LTRGADSCGRGRIGRNPLGSSQSAIVEASRLSGFLNFRSSADATVARKLGGWRKDTPAEDALLARKGLQSKTNGSSKHTKTYFLPTRRPSPDFGVLIISLFER
jgi:hypothetical protein